MDVNQAADSLQAPLLPMPAEDRENRESEEESMHNDSSGPATPEDEPPPWYSNPHQVTAMVSNFSTSYNVVNISLVLPILEELHNSTSEDAAACASSLLAGMVVGQLVGGVLGDSFLGRLGALRVVMALQIIASLASALLFGEKEDIYMALAIWRFILGVGAGGVYPLAAVLSAEQGKNSSSEDQVHRVVLTFSTQGLGFVMVPIAATSLLHITSNLDLVWRLILGFGSLPGVLLMLMQWRLYAKERDRGQVIPLEEPVTEVLHQTPEPEAVVEAGESEGMIATNEDVEPAITETRHGWWDSFRHEPGLGYKVLGTAGTWCLFDVIFYGNTIFQPIVVEAAFGASESENPIHLLRKTAQDTLILSCIALPGYAVAGMIIGRRTCCLVQTPRYVMLQGFAAMGILYFLIGVFWSDLRQYPAVLVALYGMTFFFANYGPNTTTFILPSLLYSPECRSTWNGISAAAGKLGALFGATLFEPVADEWGDKSIMLICAGLAIFAFFLTQCFVPKQETTNQDEIDEHSN